jgi:hypothetical protein
MCSTMSVDIYIRLFVLIYSVWHYYCYITKYSYVCVSFGMRTIDVILLAIGATGSKDPLVYNSLNGFSLNDKNTK